MKKEKIQNFLRMAVFAFLGIFYAGVAVKGAMRGMAETESNGQITTEAYLNARFLEAGFLPEAQLPTILELMAPIDLNSADAFMLELLPEIGPSLAERIIAYRSENGSFSSVDDLLQVSGIGPATLESVRPYCCAGK